MGGCLGESVCVCGESWAGPALFKIALGETRVMGEGEGVGARVRGQTSWLLPILLGLGGT